MRSESPLHVRLDFLAQQRRIKAAALRIGIGPVPISVTQCGSRRIGGRRRPARLKIVHAANRAARHSGTQHRRDILRIVEPASTDIDLE
jgi:hypothetical protein